MFSSLCTVRKRRECCKWERFLLKKKLLVLKKKKKKSESLLLPTAFLPFCDRDGPHANLSWISWIQSWVKDVLCPQRACYVMVQINRQANNLNTVEYFTGCVWDTTEEHRRENTGHFWAVWGSPISTGFRSTVYFPVNISFSGVSDKWMKCNFIWKDYCLEIYHGHSSRIFACFEWRVVFARGKKKLVISGWRWANL